MKRVAVLAAAAITLIAIVTWWLAPSEVAPPVTTAVAAVENVDVRREQLARAEAATPRSLQDTELDGSVSWNPDGSVRIDRALRHRFDYLLSSLGETSLPQVRSNLERQVAGRAPTQSIKQLMDTFGRYTRYLAAVDAMQPGAQTERFEAVRQRRVSMLGESMARAFFEDEERDDAAALAGRPSATPEAKELAANYEQLRAIEAQNLELEQQHADAQTRRAAREAKFGADVAQRLGALDDERAKWAERQNAFRQQKAAITSDRALDAAAQQRALDALLQRDFTEPERRRVQALEAP